MPQYVRNVTSGDYILTGEILTVNGKMPLTIRIIKGGIYEVDTHIMYNNLYQALEAGDLVPAYEDKKVEVAKPDKVTEPKKVEKVTEEPKSEEIPDNSEDSTNPIQESEEIKESEEEQVADSTDVIPDEAPFICPHCGGEYASRNNLIRHIESKHKNPEQ